MRSAFKLLKPHKADGTSLLSDHLIFALPAIEGFVAKLFTCILRHGYMPAALRDCILVPIPKGKKAPPPQIIITLLLLHQLLVKL